MFLMEKFPNVPDSTTSNEENKMFGCDHWEMKPGNNQVMKKPGKRKNGK